jgi:ADP-ribose pyrophosphatase YjhB (NUDIX family)
MRREYPQAPLVGVGAVVVNRGRVLLARRGHEPLKGEWSLPGGALELGETLEQGIAREVREECGLAVVPQAVVEVLDRIVRDEDGRVRFHYVLVDFLCRVDGIPAGAGPGEPALIAASDCLEASWVTREEMNAGQKFQLEPRTVAVIEKALRLAKTRE